MAVRKPRRAKRTASPSRARGKTTSGRKSGGAPARERRRQERPLGGRSRRVSSHDLPETLNAREPSTRRSTLPLLEIRGSQGVDHRRIDESRRIALIVEAAVGAELVDRGDRFLVVLRVVARVVGRRAP